jgi:hypothetical protein
VASLSIQEWQLLSFFEVEPRLIDRDVPWAFNTAVYDATVGAYRVTLTIAPAYSDFQLQVRSADSTLLDISAKGITDIRYVKSSAGEIIEFLVRPKHLIELRLRPVPYFREELGRYA